jgi:glycosyltransferase involved in cell wall biosynthesis
MIVTDLGVLSEVVPDGVAGYVVPPEDPASLADAAVRFFEHEPEAFRDGVEAQKKRFSWDALTVELAQFFRERISA